MYIFDEMVAVGFNTFCYDAARCRETAGINPFTPTNNSKGSLKFILAPPAALIMNAININGEGIKAMPSRIRMILKKYSALKFSVFSSFFPT